jgi:hypothetical protein
MSDLINAGYVVIDNEFVIWGYGPTVDAAWTDTVHTLLLAGVHLISENEDVPDPEQGVSWCRDSDLRTRPATAALLIRVNTCGGTVAWDERNGVACTPEEFNQ